MRFDIYEKGSKILLVSLYGKGGNFSKFKMDKIIIEVFNNNKMVN